MPLNLMPEITRFVTDDLGWDADTRQAMLTAFCAGSGYTGFIDGVDPQTGEAVQVPITEAEFVNYRLKRHVRKMCDSGSLMIARQAAEADVVKWDMDE